MNNIEKLSKILEEKGTTQLHVDWGPEAANLTPEERAGEVIKMLEQADIDDQNRVSIRVSDLYSISRALSKICRLGQWNFKDEIWKASEELVDLKGKIFGLSDMPSCLASQALPKEYRNKLRKELNE